MATFFNQATLSYSGGTVNSNIASGEIIEVLSATKTAVRESYTQGSDVTYVINIVNSGAVAFTGLTVTDDLGAFEFGTPPTTRQPLDYIDGSVRYFVNGALQATPTVTAGPPLTITGITVPAGGNAAVVYSARANEFAAPISTGSIVNTATVSGGGITPITATETVIASTEPNLSITKSISPSTVTENGQVTYTFVIQNFGNTEADATDNVILTDTFDPILTAISATYNGAAWSTPANYTYDEGTGLFTTTAGSITVPAATFTQDQTTGSYVTTPGTATITVTGTI